VGVWLTLQITGGAVDTCDMLAIVGVIIVLASVLGGFAMAGGPFGVLLATSEYVVIIGTALGTLVISTPLPVIKGIVAKVLGILKPNPYDKGLYLDCLKLLHELFQMARRDGLIAIEGHIEGPEKSTLFKKYPKILHHHHLVVFLCDSLRLVLLGSVPAFDLDGLLDSEIDVHHEVNAQIVSAITKVSDSLPGIGIVAAVLGIVVTMQAVGGPIEAIGHHVASALVGTFLGILLSYGFVGPIATSIEMRDSEESRALVFMKSAVIAFAKGVPPMVACEFARRAIAEEKRPSFLAMETACKEAAKKAA
jgi:chemotaxis protein MotA